MKKCRILKQAESIIVKYDVGDGTMRCKVYELGFLEEYKYVVVLSEYNGKIVLSRHKERTTWETQGGHIEQGETPLDAAKRELYEESGAVDFEIKPLCDYRAWNEETGHGANGVVFHAVIHEFGAIPDSEMAEIREFTELPENLTYPAITPVLFNHLSRKPELHRMKLKASPFRKIQNGSKTIELRLNDEKRQQVQVGDFIEFTMLDDTAQKLTVRVTALHHFNSFAELYAALPKEKLGYAPDEMPDPDHMDAYYPRDKQEKYGVLGIEMRLTDLQKFVDAQEHGYSFGETYETALSEMKQGQKMTHWIWYVFPQIQGLGISGTTAYFSIKDLNEARDYYSHPVLGARLIEITEELLKIGTDDPMAVFGYPDAYKVRSCMTLFKYAAPEHELFQKVLDKFCRGMEDDKTVEILGV